MDEPVRRPKQINKNTCKLFCSVSISKDNCPIEAISKNGTVVHVVEDICDKYKDTDNYFCAYIYPSPNTLLAAAVAVPVANSTTLEPVQIQAEYADLKAAFSDGLTHLPEHGNHDMTI